MIGFNPSIVDSLLESLFSMPFLTSWKKPVDASAQRSTRRLLEETVEFSVKEASSFTGNFIRFLRKGPAVDLGVGIIIGGGFSTLVDSFLADILLPPFGYFFGTTLTNYFIVLKDGKVGGPYKTLDQARSDGAVTENIGSFLNNVILFLAISLLIFWLIQCLWNLSAKTNGCRSVSFDLQTLPRDSQLDITQNLSTLPRVRALSGHTMQILHIDALE